MQLSIDDEDRRQREIEAARANLKRIESLIQELQRQLRRWDERIASGQERSPLAAEERAAMVERIEFLIPQADEIRVTLGLPPKRWRKV